MTQAPVATAGLSKQIPIRNFAMRTWFLLLFISTLYAYGDFNELNSTTPSVGNPTSYNYDNDGNRVSKLLNGVKTSYDRFNRLVGVSNPANEFEPHQYAYDFRSRRVWRKDANQSTTQSSWIVFAGGTSVQEYVDGNFGNPLTAVPEVMYARGSDQGGGVGGLLYMGPSSRVTTTSR